jgi:hypothetical protein
VKCDVSPQQDGTRRICSCQPIVPQGGQYDPSLLLVCMIWSFGSVIMVIPMVRRPTPGGNTEWTTPIVRYYSLKYDCPELTTPLNHAEDQHVLGWIGLMQFVLGVVDLASSAWLIYKLWNFDDEAWLWRCAVVTFAVTTLATALVCQDAIQVLKDPMTQPPRNERMEPRSLDSMTASERSHQVSRRAELEQDQVSVLMEKAWAIGIDRDTLFGILDCVEQDGDSMSKARLQTSIVDLIMEEASPRANPEATDRWVKAHGLLLAFIGFCSLSRFESLAIVRLKLRVPTCISKRGHISPWPKMPMSDKQFWFLRFAGWYHYLIEDIPHLLLSVLVLTQHPDEHFAYVRVCLSVSAMVFGMLNKSHQKVVEHRLERVSLLGGSE